MATLSLILLIIVVSTGFLFSVYSGIRFIRRFKSKIPNVLFWFWSGMPFLILFTLNNGKPSLFFSQLNFYVVNVFLATTTLFSAFGANILNQNIENSISPKKKVRHISRLLVMLYGSLCIAIFLSIIRSSAYMSGFVDYKPNAELQQVVHADSLERINEIRMKQFYCSSLIKRLKQVDNQELGISKKNAFTYFNKRYIIQTDNNDFRLEYVPSGGDQYPITHYIIFFPEKSSNKKYEHILKVGGRKLKIINRDTVIHSVKKDLVELGKKQLNVINKPIGLIPMVAANMLDTLGVKTHEYTPVGKNAKLLDTLLYWLSFFVTGFLFFIYGKAWNK